MKLFVLKLLKASSHISEILSTQTCAKGISVMFSSPKPLGSQGELIVYPCRRPS